MDIVTDGRLESLLVLLMTFPFGVGPTGVMIDETKVGMKLNAIRYPN
jgi:hypothetical protein